MSDNQTKLKHKKKVHPMMFNQRAYDILVWYKKYIFTHDIPQTNIRKMGGLVSFSDCIIWMDWVIKNQSSIIKKLIKTEESNE